MTQTEPQTSPGAEPPEPAGKKGLSEKLDAAGWGLFFIWVGIAFLADFGWGWGLVGVAAIILSEAALRWRLGLKVGGFWIAVGAVFLLGGLWELFRVPWPLAPVLLILCGLAILWGALAGRHVMRK
jgi:hypothetical protein